MEKVWDDLRGNKLSHRVWDTYDAIVQACADAWRFLIGDPERIRSIATRSWAPLAVGRVSMFRRAGMTRSNGQGYVLPVGSRQSPVPGAGAE